VPPEQLLTHPKRDLFAELYVAGLFADAGWGVYFPKRDQGFDFIAVKNVDSVFVVRPVQVKGKYPQKFKKDKSLMGTLANSLLFMKIWFWRYRSSSTRRKHRLK
jgi:hypothetical protein